MQFPEEQATRGGKGWVDRKHAPKSRQGRLTENGPQYCLRLHNRKSDKGAQTVSRPCRDSVREPMRTQHDSAQNKCLEILTSVLRRISAGLLSLVPRCGTSFNPTTPRRCASRGRLSASAASELRREAHRTRRVIVEAVNHHKAGHATA